MSEAVFKKEVEKVIEFYEEIICHAASRARNMIRDYREVEAISRLVVNADLQQGFKVLRDHGRLDKTFEALVIKFQHLFKPEVVQAAKWRLENPNELFR